MEETKNKAAPVIRLQDVRKEYVVGDSHIHALDGVSLTVSPGEFVCISGRSGSGKSTMLNMLAGLEKPTSGEIVILDKHIENMSESARIRFRRQYIGFVFQSYNLMPQYTAVENVELPLMLRGVGRRERRRQALAVMEQVGIVSHAEHKPSELSGGQQQRVGIARALITKPPIVFADELTGNLDTKNKRGDHGSADRAVPQKAARPLCWSRMTLICRSIPTGQFICWTERSSAKKQTKA